MRRLSRLIGFTVWLLSVVSPSFSQSPQSTPAPLEAKLAVEVTASDSRGVAVTDLLPDQLEVRADRKAITDFTLTPAGTEPQSVVLLVDTSGSTYEDQPAIRHALDRLITALPAADELALVDFSASAYVDTEMTSDRSAVRKGLQYLKASGGSAINDAVIAAASYVESRGRFRSRLIVLLSDGEDNASTQHRDAAVAALSMPGAPVLFALDCHKANSRHNRSQDAPKALQQLAEATGGVAYGPWGNDEVDSSVTAIMDLQAHRFRLEIPAATISGAGRISIMPGKDLRQKKVDVNAPQSKLGT